MCNSYNYCMLVILIRQMVCLKKCMFCIILLYNPQLSVIIFPAFFAFSVINISSMSIYM